MSTKKQDKGKKSANKEDKQATSISPEQVVIALALAQALGTPHDEETYKLTIMHKPFDPWSYKLQSMRITPTKQYNI